MGLISTVCPAAGPSLEPTCRPTALSSYAISVSGAGRLMPTWM